MEIREVPTQAGYDQWSASYDETGNPLVALEDQVLRRLVPAANGFEVLDLGCGTGRHSMRFAEMGARVTGLDFSSGMLEVARKKSQGLAISYIQHNLLERLPLVDASFDLAFSSLVVEHLPSVEGFFREIKRVVRPGGRIIICDLHPAMRLRGAVAQFTDHERALDIRPKGYPHSVSEFVLATQGLGLWIEAMEEAEGDSELAVDCPKMEKYVGWPMLLVLVLRSPS